MSDLILIIRRELVERRMLLYGSLTIGTMILLIAFAPGNPPIPDIWNVMSGWWAIIAIFAISLYAGSSFVASELREGRFSFYLSRPVPVASIWGGKMLAAWLLSLISAFLVMVPVTLTGNGLVLLFKGTGGEWSLGRGREAIIVLVLVAVALALVAIGHAAGIALRARSPWLLLDFVAISVTSIIAVLALRPLMLAFAYGLVGSMLGIAIFLVTVFLFTAGVSGVLRGRSDLTAVHRTTSIIAAIGLGCIALAMSAYSSQVRSTAPHELETIELLECGTLECSPVFTGSAAGLGDYHAVFSIQDGGVVSLPQAQIAGSDPKGAHVVWAIPTAVMNPMFDYSFRTSPDTTPTTLGLEEAMWRLARFALDGDRLAYLVDGTVTVIDLAQDRIVRAVRLDEFAEEASLDFLGENHILATTREGEAFETTYRIHDIDLVEGEVSESGSFSALVFWRQEGKYVSRQGFHRRVHDRRTGAVIVEREADDVIVAGSAVVFELGSRPVVLEVTDLEGSTVARIELPDTTDAVMGERVADGRLAVAVVTSGRIDPRGAWGDASLILVDLETGAFEQIANDLVPARVQSPRVRGPYYLQSGANGPNRLVRFEPASGGRHVIAGKPGREETR